MVMQKIIVNPYSNNQEWCKDYFPDRSLGTLPVAGKTAAEYYIDFALRCQAESLLLLGPTYNEHLAESLEEHKGGSLAIDYLKGGGHTTVRELLNTYPPDSGDCLVIHGMLLPKIHAVSELENTFIPCSDAGEADGIYCFRDGKLLRSTADAYRMNSLKSYFEVNFEILKEDYYNVPGYSVSNGIYTGMNVILKQNCELAGPLLLDDNTLIESNTVIADAILGKRALVDKGTTVRHAVVFEHTYLAGNLEIINKIVTPGRIIDPNTGGVLERNSFSYAFSPIQNRSAWLLRLWEHTLALILALTLGIPWLLLLPYYLLHRKSHWCWKLSMDRYPGYWEVLFFRKELVKSHPANEHFVFQMGESYGLQNTPEQRRIYDYYYHYHCSCFLILQVVLRSLGKRGFATYVERKRA